MNRTARFAALYVALAAMMLRALIPMGWMPSTGGTNAPLVICTMQGPMLLDSHGQPQSPRDGKHQSEACPFAAAPNLASPATVADIAPPSDFIVFAQTGIASRAIAPAAHYAPQSPRAPPFLA